MLKLIGKRQNFIVAIVGPVGVGKSTLGKLLAFSFIRLGHKASLHFIKSFHGMTYVVWRLVHMVVLGKWSVSWLAPWYVLGRVRPELAKKLVILSLYIDTLFALPLSIFSRVLIPKLLGKIIIIEEYLLGTIADYFFNLLRFSISFRRFNVLLKILIAMYGKFHPDIVLILDAEFDELFRRWKSRGYGDLQLFYVAYQKHILPFLARMLNGRAEIIIIHTDNMNTCETLRDVLSKLFKA